MARKKYIDDNTLITLIDTYYLESGRSERALQLPQITDYINANGYPKYQVTSLRRNEKAKEHIQALLAASKEKGASLLISYKTLDVQAFLDRNSTRQKMITALTELDTYYKSICENALSMQKEAVSYKTKLDSASKKVENLTDKLQSLSNTNKELKLQNHELSQQLDAHKKVLLQYVYPDVATELLKEQGLIKGDVESCIKNQALSEQIISPTSSILPIETENKIPEKQANHSSESNIIQGLFNNLEGI